MKKIISFLSYHNAVPAVLIILALGAGATFAATTNDVLPLSDSTASSTPSGPDASFLIATDLDTYTPTAKVTGVTEDAENYYVSYALSTIAIVGNAWQPTVENETLTISKAALGAYRDLGLYVADQLQQRTAQELAYLQRAQAVAEESAQNQSSGTQVASAYASLVGKTLDADSSAIPGYTPVVENPAPTILSAPAPLPQNAPAQNPAPQTSADPQTIEDSQSATSSDTYAASSTPQDDSETAVTSTEETSTATSTEATSTPVATGAAGTGDASSTPQVAPTDATSTDDTVDASQSSATSTPTGADADATSTDQ